MEFVVAAARLFLASVLFVAGIAKLVDRAGSRDALVGFGAHPRLAPKAAIVLPVVELATAVALLPGSIVRWGAVAALALLLVFAGTIALNLARGRSPECRCFGQLHSVPAGPRTLARNGVLALVAALVVWHSWSGGAPSAWSVLSRGPAELVGVSTASALLFLVLVRTDVVLSLLRRSERLSVGIDSLKLRLQQAIYAHHVSRARAREGLAPGSAAPLFSLPTLAGETAGLASLLADGKPVLLVFADPECLVCDELLPEVAAWQARKASSLSVAIVSEGTPAANADKMRAYGDGGRVFLQRDREILEAYRVEGSPSAVLVNPDGTIGSTVAGGAAEIRELVTRTAIQPAATAARTRAATPGSRTPNATGQTHDAHARETM